MDDIDRASRQEELARELAIANRPAVYRPQPNGTCHNPDCMDDLPEGFLFCGKGCALEYERHVRHHGH